jgi:hypothetical protein
MEFGMDGRGGDDQRPGRKLFSPECKVILCRFVVGDRGPDVMHHIDNCWPCSMVIHGDGKTMPTSIFDDVDRKRLVRETRTKDEGRVLPSADVLEMSLDREILETQVTCNTTTVAGDSLDGPVGGVRFADAERLRETVRSVEPSPISTDSALSQSQKSSRRRLLGLAIAAAAVAVVGGSITFFQHRSDATRTQKSATTGLVNGTVRTTKLARWDFAYQGGNVGAVRTMIARAQGSDLMIAFDWIAERRISALYPDLVTFLVDPNLDTRSGALGSIFLIPPVQLKPHLGALQNARSLETDPALQSASDEYITAVMKS